MKTTLTINAFEYIANSKNEFKTYGDIYYGGYLQNLINQEVLGNVFRAPISVDGNSNISFEYTTIPKGGIFNGKQEISQVPILNRVVYSLPEDKYEFSYKISNFIEKEAKDWADYLSTEDSKRWTQLQNQNNVVAIQAIQLYATAVGQWKVLSALSNPAAKKEEWFDETAKISDLALSITATQTVVNWGANPEDIAIMFAPLVMRRIATGISAVNVSQGAYDAVKLGRINNLFGLNFDTSIYLNQKGEIITGKGYDFTNLFGILYHKLALGFYQQTPKVLNLESKTDREYRERIIVWKPFAVMLPSMEHLAYIFVKTAPTIDAVNAARKELLTMNPTAYKSLVGGAANVLETAEYNKLVDMGNDFAAVQKPNVEVPADAFGASETKGKK